MENEVTKKRFKIDKNINIKEILEDEEKIF